jgi:hypothetical protein
MRIIKPTSGDDLRLWAWSEFSGFTKGLIAAVPVAIIVFALVFVPGIRHSEGAFAELHGVVRAVGNYEVGGGNLTGRIAVLATVTLSDGRVVQTVIRKGLQVNAGADVVVREYPQNFGQPIYAIYEIGNRAPFQ